MKCVSQMHPSLHSEENRGSSLLEDVINNHERSPYGLPGRHLTAVNSGRSVTLAADENGCDLLTVISPVGRVEMSIRLTESGPVAELSGVSLELRSANSICLDCDDFSIHTKGDVSIESEGDIIQKSDRNFSISSSAETSVGAGSISIDAQAGNIDIQSREVVDVKGRLIGLNREPL